MTILEQLKVYEDSSLNGWTSKSRTNKEKFMDEIVDFACNNDHEFKSYVTHLEPNGSSVLEIVYEALSKYSDVHFEFLRQETNRMFDLLVKENVDDDDLDVLDGIALKRFYQYDYDNFKGVLEDLIPKLSSKNDNETNVLLIETIESYILKITEETHKLDVEKLKADLYAQAEQLSRSSEKKLIKEIFNEYKENPVSKFSKVALMLVLFGYSLFLYSDFYQTLDLNLFNTKRLIILYLVSGFVLSIFFDFTFRIIKSILLRLIITILILAPIGLKIVFYLINFEKLQFLKDWLFIAS